MDMEFVLKMVGLLEVWTSYRMKRLLFVPLILSLIPSVNARETCNFVSEYYPDVTIEIDNDEKKFGGWSN